MKAGPRRRGCAIEVLHEMFELENVAVERFVREAKGLLRSSHPNVCRLLDVGSLVPEREGPPSMVRSR